MIDSLQKEGKLPAQITQRTRDEMAKSLSRYFGDASAKKISEFTDKAREVAEAALKTDEDAARGGATVGVGKATGRDLLSEFLEGATGESAAGAFNVDFFLRVAGEVAEGAGQLLAQNIDPTRVQEFPALELHRVFEREVPRGSEKDPAGETNGWDAEGGRWEAACEEAGDDDAMAVWDAWGRMVALKSSGVWEALGEGAGGYEDVLGNAFAPFAFNSGMMTDEVGYDEAVELGLLDDGDEAEPAALDFDDLLGLKAMRVMCFGAIKAEEAGHPFHGNQYSEGLSKFMPPSGKQFKFGDCDVEVGRMTREAVESGHKDFTVVLGSVDHKGSKVPIPPISSGRPGTSDHVWLEENGKIIDPTANQFKGKLKYHKEEEFDPEEYLKKIK